MSISSDEFSKDKVKERMSTFTSDVENRIGNYSHSTSKLIEFTTEDTYNEIFEDDEFTTDEFEFIESN